jgi:hypothetical protein
MKFYSSISRISGILFILILLSSFRVGAQNATSSPYSRYGIGELQFGGFIKNRGMGGIGQAVNLPISINYSNPASYSSLWFTTYELGAHATFLELKNTKGTGAADDISFGYFSMGFPVKLKKWGLTFGLLPYSNVGYSITKEELNEIGDRRNLDFEGTGGLNQFFIGNGFNITKSLALGVNASFLFGTIDQVRKVSYPDGGYINSRITDKNIVNDLYFTFGLQQTFDSLKLSKSDSLVMYEKERIKNSDSLKVLAKQLSALKAEQSVEQEQISLARNSLSERNNQIDSLYSRVQNRKQRGDWSLTLGLTGAPSMKLKGKRSLLMESYLVTGFGTEVVRDTALNLEDSKGKLVMPLSIGFGAAMRKGTKWLIGADFTLQNWQDYSLFGQTDSLANSWRVAAGAQLVPNDRSGKSYLGIVNYRMGFHYEQTYLNINSTQLNSMGVSAGFGFPFKRSATMIQVAVEAGTRGTTENNLIQENYVKCSLGFTLSDRWFIKPVFD